MRLTAKIPLVNPLVLEKGNIKSIEMDIFQVNPVLIESMDVIRACNVITLSYYSESQIKQALSILHLYIRPNGFLLISRNHPERKGEIERGTIWQKKNDTYAHVADFGGGSEIKGILKNSENPIEL